MITNVSLINWRSHLQSELEFCEGTNCLIGRMGSGKSSVLDAICFGLFGTFPQLQQKKVRLEDMIMKKPKAQRFAEVKISFESGGDGYSVKRRVEKGKSTAAEFRKNGKLVEMQSQKVTEEVERALKVDYDLFTRAVYSEQNQLDMFLTIPKGQRMKKIDELLRLDKFEAARVSTVSLRNRFSFHREEKEKLLENMKESEMASEAETLKADIGMLAREKESLASEAEKAAEKKRQLREKVEGIEKVKEEIRALSDKISLLEKLSEQLKSDISLLGKQLAHARPEADAEELKRKMDALKGQISSASREANAARNSFLGKKLQFGAERDRLSQLEKLCEEKKRLCGILEDGKIAKAKSMLAEVSENIGKMAIETGSIKAEIAGCELAKDIRNDRCMVCGHELPEEKKRELILESGKRIEALSARRKEIENEMGKLASERRKLEVALSELERAEAKMKEIGDPEADAGRARQNMEILSKEVLDIEKQIHEMEKGAASLQSSLESLIREYESAKSDAARRAELERKQRNLETNNAEASALKARLEETAKTFSEPELKECRERMESLIGVEKAIEAKLHFTDEIISEKRKRLESAEARKKMAEECRIGIRKAAAMEEQLQLLERGLQATQEQMRKDFVGAINHAMQMIWENLYPYTDFSSARIAIDGDYILQLEDSNGWVPIDSVSGGERSIACLTLRIAFALVLAPQLRWLVLDEPTHNLDEKAVAELANVLRDNIIEFVEQVFLITHDPALETAVSGYLYRMEKEKEGFTGAVKVDGG